jgi:hypothetical protein
VCIYIILVVINGATCRLRTTKEFNILKKLIIILNFFSTVTLLAQQEEVEIKIQDTLYFNHCNSTSYQYIDYYKKTRFEEKDTNDLTHIYNWDFYNTFFNTGDFDVSRLPCSMNGKYGIIKHIMSISNEEKKSQTVVIAMIENNISAAYITEKAFLNDELIYAPKK